MPDAEMISRTFPVETDIHLVLKSLRDPATYPPNPDDGYLLIDLPLDPHPRR